MCECTMKFQVFWDDLGEQLHDEKSSKQGENCKVEDAMSSKD